MKVLLINGSPNEKGCTWRALKEVADTLEKEGVESEILHIGKKPIGGCIGCGGCSKNNGRCVFNNDPVNEVLDKMEMQLATPSSGDPARTIAFLDYAAREERAAVEIHDTLAAHRSALMTLGTRHAALVREAESGTTHQPGNPR